MKEIQPVQIPTNLKKYKMNHNSRGRAYIFNYDKFNDLLSARKGSELDVERIKFILSRYYGFEVIVCTDYTQGKIYEILSKATSEDYSNCDCILMVVMSHGEEGKLYAKDTLYQVEDLWAPFANCQTLKGKPKIFIIQSFWGTENDFELNTVPSSISKFPIPTSPDILVMYSTFEGYYTVRSTKTVGSWFIQRLCDELENVENRNRDLIEILTLVNQSKNHKSRLICRKKQINNKQVGVIVSSLTGLVYLSRKDIVT